MNDLKVFAYGGQQVRTLLIEKEPWWVLTDVCKVLGLSNASNVSRRLDADERMTVTRGYSHPGQRGGAQRTIIVNERGLYSVILRSDKPKAKEFKRWITHDVLPSIRQSGTYTPPNVPVAVPAEPKLPEDVRLKRAELLIRAAEHPALPQEEQLRLLNRAVLDLTGTGIKLPEAKVDPSVPCFPRAHTGVGREEVE